MAITAATDSMKQVREYWDSYLEYNPLRTGPKETDAGAFLAHQIQAAGDVLRELAKDVPDPAYMKEKTQRIRRSLPWKRDWTDPLSLGEQQRLGQTKELLQGLPTPTKEAEILKCLLTDITERDTTAIAKSLDELEPLLFGPASLYQPAVVTTAPPRVLSMDEYRNDWQPQGWQLIIIGPTATWRQEWGEWEAIRDIVQNALDEAEAYRWGYDDEGLWISDRGRGVAVADFLLGPPKLKPDYARGKFGEGMKIAALALVRKGYSVRVETLGRELWIIFLKQTVDGVADTLAALWRSNGRMQGTEFHIIGYRGPAFERYFTVNLPRNLILWQTPSKVIKPVRRYNQLIKAEGMATSSLGGLIYARDIYMKDIRSPFSYNLWGFEMAPDRHGPKDEADMWVDMGRLWCGVTRVDLLEKFFEMVCEPAKVIADENYSIRMEEWALGREPVSDKTYATFIKENASYWQTAWRNVFGNNAVIRTSDRWNGTVKHLGYVSVDLQYYVRDTLGKAVTTDTDLVKASQEKLRDVQVIPDERLTPRQLAHLKLARAIAAKFLYPKVGGVHAAIIPPASDRVRTAGMYGRTTQEVYIASDQLESAERTVDTVVHELAHHLSGAEDLEEAHSEWMTRVAARVVFLTSRGEFDELLKEVVW